MEISIGFTKVNGYQTADGHVSANVQHRQLRIGLPIGSVRAW